MKNPALTLCCLAVLRLPVMAQPCTPLGNQTSYGTNDVWIGYVYNNVNFTNYQGYVNEGVAGNPSFNQGFGGSNVSYSTNGCATNTETFSVRYKLQKTFASGNYEFVAGGDDGYRLSIDGGVTWIIDRWFDQGYNTTASTNFLNGTYNLVFEFYENSGGNQVSFQVQPACVASGSTATYGTGNIWQGYLYDGTNFSTYRGSVTKGSAGNPNFDENFGGANTMYSTSACAVQTETFSARYRLQRAFANGTYIFILGGDDGYRFSLDGGSTWVIDRWSDQSYNTTSYTTTLNGTYNLVIEYYENSGDNRISFDMAGSLLPVRLVEFNGNMDKGQADLKWKIAAGSNPDYFEIERSINGQQFQSIGHIPANGTSSQIFAFTDKNAPPGNCYYRLAIFDLDRVKTLSQIVLLTNHRSPGITIYPTIVQNSNVYVTSGKMMQNVSISIFDISGKKISYQHLKLMMAGQTVSIPLFSKEAGNYFIEVKSVNEREIKKLVLTH